MQTKYQEYRMKAEQLNKLLQFLHKDYVTIDTVILDGTLYRLRKIEDNNRAIIVEPL